jgi:cytochrome c peroxidase
LTAFFSTPEEIINFTTDGGDDHSLQNKRIRPLNLSEQDKTELKIFFVSLTSSGLNCLIAEARNTNSDNQQRK